MQVYDLCRFFGDQKTHAAADALEMYSLAIFSGILIRSIQNHRWVCSISYS